MNDILKEALIDFHKHEQQTDKDKLIFIYHYLRQKNLLDDFAGFIRENYKFYLSPEESKKLFAQVDGTS